MSDDCDSGWEETKNEKRGNQEFTDKKRKPRPVVETVL